MSDAKPNKPIPAIMWYVGVPGLLFLIISFVSSAIRPDVGNFTAESQGVVSYVEVSRSGKKSSHTSYITHVRFTDSDHRTYEAQSIVNGDWQRHFEGDEVTVRYDPRDPEAGILIKGDEDKLGSFNTLMSIFRYGGAAAVVVSVVVLIVSRLRT